MLTVKLLTPCVLYKLWNYMKTSSMISVYHSNDKVTELMSRQHIQDGNSQHIYRSFVKRR